MTLDRQNAAKWLRLHMTRQVGARTFAKLLDFFGEIDDILAAVRRCGSLDYTRAQARLYHDRALAQLQQLPASDWRSSLEKITHLSIDRDR